MREQKTCKWSLPWSFPAPLHQRWQDIGQKISAKRDQWKDIGEKKSEKEISGILLISSFRYHSWQDQWTSFMAKAENVPGNMKTWWREIGGDLRSPNPCDTWKDLGRRRHSKTSCWKRYNCTMAWKYMLTWSSEWIMIVPGVEFAAVLEPQAFQAQIAMTKLGGKIMTVFEVENHDKGGRSKSWQSLRLKSVKMATIIEIPNIVNQTWQTLPLWMMGEGFVVGGPLKPGGEKDLHAAVAPEKFHLFILLSKNLTKTSSWQIPLIYCPQGKFEKLPADKKNS